MRWFTGLVGLVVVACSAGDAASDGDGREGNGAKGSAGTASGGGGSGAPGGGSTGTDAFGNPLGPPPAAPPEQNGGAGSGCEVGMFCKSTDPDPGDCGSLRLETDVEITRTPGNMLVIFDQSGSMDQPWTGGGGSKLQSAQNALVQALTPLQDDLTVGAIFFPTLACVPFFPPPPGGAVQPIDGAQQIPFQPGPQFLTSWMNHWSNRPVGDNIGTPMQEAFDRANLALDAGMLTGNTIVVAFTDGEPNCFPYDDGIGAAPATTGANLMSTQTEPMHAAAWLANSNIKTYMVGLPGANGVQILNDVAVSGGTMQYIVPDDPAQLEMKLREVVQETVKSGFNSCAITLTPAANPPEKLLMIVEETSGMRQNVPHEAGADGAGWTVSDDGVQVEITGPLCDDAMGGRFSSITFEYGCPDVPPPPTLPPVL
jgi:hypothetical protein